MDGKIKWNSVECFFASRSRCDVVEEMVEVFTSKKLIEKKN